MHHEAIPYDAPLFREHENLDFNVGKEKPKKTKVNKQPTEAQEDREHQARQKEVERKKKQLNEYELLKKQVVECKKKTGQEKNRYEDVLEDLKHQRGLRKTAKDELQQTIIEKYREKIQKTKDKYKEVYEFMKTHKLKDDLNEVYKHINLQIKKIEKS
jgi:hypothetical protein